MIFKATAGTKPYVLSSMWMPDAYLLFVAEKKEKVFGKIQGFFLFLYFDLELRLWKKSSSLISVRKPPS